MSSSKPIRASDHGTAYRASGGGWRDRAACGRASPREQDAMTGGPGGGGQSTHAARDAVRKFCDNCPVRVECFAWGQGERDFMGIAGGYLFGFDTGRHYRPEGRRLVKL